MRQDNNKGRLATMVILIVANIALIFFGANLLGSSAPGQVLIASLIIFIIGLLGLLTVWVLSSKLNHILKSLLVVGIVGGGIFSGWYYWTHHENIIESYIAVMVSEANETDIKFIEYNFSTRYALRTFIARANWYMGDEGVKERRQILDYYYAVKAEEKEFNRTLIKRFYVSAPPIPSQSSTLLAYVDEYRSGPFAVKTNLVYNIATKQLNVNEDEE